MALVVGADLIVSVCVGSELVFELGLDVTGLVAGVTWAPWLNAFGSGLSQGDRLGTCRGASLRFSLRLES